MNLFSPRLGGYLIAHACFGCRKSFKVRPQITAIRCPECGHDLCCMGRSFKAPKNNDIGQWKKVEKLWNAGFRFWSYRSAPDAERLPIRLSDVDDFITRNPNHPFRISDEKNSSKK